MNKVINKGLVSAIFSDRGDLLITAADLAESMISISMSGDSVQRLKSTMRSVLSVNFFKDGEVTISLVKTSNVAKAFMDQSNKSSIIPGSLTLALDNGGIMKLDTLTFEIDSYDNSGNSANIDIIVKGDIKVNSGLL